METLLPIAARIAQRLKDRNETLAVAESSAGGLIAAALLAVPGASAYFRAGAVVYTRAARRELMGIADAEMQGMRSASEPYALLLARTVRRRVRADWGLAETGASGPTGNSYGDAPGHACIAVSGGEAATERTITLETGSDDRVANMRVFAKAALEALEAALARSREVSMGPDTERIDEAVLGLLYLTLHDGSRAWKGFEWGALSRLHEKGLIEDPVNKAKSVVLTPAGLERAQRAFEAQFGGKDTPAR